MDRTTKRNEKKIRKKRIEKQQAQEELVAVYSLEESRIGTLVIDNMGNRITVDNWVELIAVICEFVEKRRGLSGADKKLLVMGVVEFVLEKVELDEDLEKVIHSSVSATIDVIIALSKNEYGLNISRIKKLMCCY